MISPQGPPIDQVRETWDALADRFDEFATPEFSMPLGAHVLDGMFRMGSGGSPAAVLHTEMNIGVGTK